MTWFLITNWAFVAAILFVVLNRKRPTADEMIWTGVLCLLWPVLLLFFLIGTALESVREFTSFGTSHNLPKAGAVDKISRLWGAVLAITRDHSWM
jgi:hypothetical protein